MLTSAKLGVYNMKLNICSSSFLKAHLDDRNTVKDAILNVFAGPPDTGIFSPSVQNTLYLTEKLVLDTVPEVTLIPTG